MIKVKYHPREKCTFPDVKTGKYCGQPSMTGFKPSQGKCQYHWVLGAYGKEAAEPYKPESKN